jgi:hypothetical protein
LPSWIEEGIASRYDNSIRKDAREQLTRSWARTGRSVGLEQVLTSTDLHSTDEYSYAAATSLVSFLLTREDAQTLLEFAEDGQRVGWNAALQTHYRIETFGQLQSEWEAWLASSFSNPGDR